MMGRIPPTYTSGYRIFRKMLESGHPPDDWDRLLAEARAEADRLQKLVTQTTAAQP
jgi:toxin YhaV